MSVHEQEEGKNKKEEMDKAMSKSPLMRLLPRDFITSLLQMLGMKDSARLGTAMSEKKGREMFLEMLASGDVWFEGSKHAEDYITGGCLRWLGKHRLEVERLSCSSNVNERWSCSSNANDNVVVTAELVLSVVRNNNRNLRLHALHLRHWILAEAAISEIASFCQNVTTLDFTRTKNLWRNGIDDSVVVPVVIKMHKLKTLNLSGCCGVTNASLEALASHCSHIIKADFTDCMINDDGIAKLVQGCPLIEELKLCYVKELTDVGIKALANGCCCRSIKSLNISGSKLITDESIKVVAKQCSNLQAIDISNIAQLTSVAITHLADFSLNLIAVDIRGCLLTAQEDEASSVIHLIKTRGSRLQSLHLPIRFLLNEDCVKAIAENCPSSCTKIMNQCDAEGCTALWHACNEGNNALIEVLLNLPCDVDAHVPNYRDETPAFMAIANGRTGTLKILLSHPTFDVNKTDRNGMSLLHRVTDMGRSSSFRVLLSHPQINVNATDNRGKTALYLASYAGDTTLVRLLLTHQIAADVNIADDEGKTALYVACEREALYDACERDASYLATEHTAIVKLLLAVDNIDVNRVDNEGKFALYAASERGHSEAVERLLSHPKVDVNMANLNRKTPLHIASANEHADAVKLLLTHDTTDVNMADNQGRTPLWYASEKGSVVIMKLLLNHPTNANVNMADINGNTPLYIASEKDNNEAVELLMSHPNIEVHVTDFEDETLLC